MPFPSSPHWAPMMAIAGMALLRRNETAPAQVHRSSAATRYQRPTLAAARSGARVVSATWIRSSSSPTAAPAPPTRRRLAAALAVLRAHAVGRGRRRPPTRASSTASCTAPGSRRIVVAGGDGSLHAVIAALHRRNELKNAVLGLLPMGTGNDFARGLGIPLDIEEAARVILADKQRRWT